MELINKSAIVAEIERRIKETESMQPKFDQFWAGQISAFKGILKIINTLGVKEVDLEKEIKSWLDHGHITDTRYDDYDDNDIESTAKHFFELGLKTKKGE